MGRPSVYARGCSWCRRHCEIPVGVIGGLVLAALVLILAEASTQRMIFRILAWVARSCHELDGGLH